MGFRVPLLFVFLFLNCLDGYGAEATGFLHTDGCDFLGESLHLQKLDGHKLNRPIILRVPKLGLLGVSNEWTDVPGKECKDSEPCEALTHAKIQVLKVSEPWSFLRWQRFIRGASGNFSVDLADGRKIEGTFKAKVARQKLVICE